MQPTSKQKNIDAIKNKAKELDEKMLNIPIEENNEPLVKLNSIEGLKFKEEKSSYYVRKTIADKLKKINQQLYKSGLGLFVRDTWRSSEKQKKSWDKEINRLKKLHPNKSAKDIEKMASVFVFPPGLSPHATGASVDVQIFDLNTGKVVDFGLKGFRDELCYTDHPDIKGKARKHRQLLKKHFEEEDFSNYLLEYWHFSYGNAEWAAYKNKESAFYGAISLSNDEN